MGERGPLDRSRYNARAKAIRALRRLAAGLEVPGDECTELERMHGRDFGDLSDGLLNALDTATTATGASGNLKRMREQHQCATTGHLVATAYRNHWLPDNEELRLLLRGRMPWGSHGLRTTPPFRWIEEA